MSSAKEPEIVEIRAVLEAVVSMGIGPWRGRASAALAALGRVQASRRNAIATAHRLREQRDDLKQVIALLKARLERDAGGD